MKEFAPRFLSENLHVNELYYPKKHASNIFLGKRQGVFIKVGVY